MILRTKHKIFIASIAFRFVRILRNVQGKGMQGQFQRAGFNWQLDLREVVDFMIYISGGFEAYLSRFIRNNVKGGDVVMDIGANIGAHTLAMGKSVGASGRVYAIEATEYAYSKLQTNIALNPELSSQVEAIHCILAASDNVADSFEIHSSWPFESKAERHSSHQGVTKSVGAAPAISLDTLVASHGITRLDFIKMDVDGHEWDVLSGGRQTFERMRPVIVMEIAPDYHDPEHAKGFFNIHRFLSELGYTFHDFNGAVLPQQAKALAATIPDGASKNVVLLPQGARLPQF